MEKKRTLGLVLVFLASLFWSLNSPLVKSIELDAFMLTGMRALIAGIALAPFIRFRRIKWSIYTLLMLVTYTAQCACIVLALKMTSTGVAVGMQFTAPVWLYFMERKKGDKPTFRRLWPLGVLLAGTVLFMCSKAEGTTLAGNLIALSTSFWFAALTYFSKKATGGNPIGMTSISNLVCAMVALPIAGNVIPKLAALPAGQWPLLIALGVMQIGFGYACYYLALRHISAQSAAMISPLEMVLGPLWVAIFMHEYPDVISLIAFALVIAGAVGEVIVTRPTAQGSGDISENHEELPAEQPNVCEKEQP